MSVLSPQSTKQMRESAKYFSNFLDMVRKSNSSDSQVTCATIYDAEFSIRIRDAGYASSILINPVFRGYANAMLGKNCVMPSLKKARHVSTICSTYAIGNSEITSDDVEELRDVCESIPEIIDSMNISKPEVLYPKKDAH